MRLEYALRVGIEQRFALFQARLGFVGARGAVEIELADLLHEEPIAEAGPMLIDCLTLWLSNIMLAERDVEAERERLVEALSTAAGPIVVVSNEVGLGIVPDNALARAFRDEQGRLNAAVAAVADTVVLMAAGLPLTLKQP